MYRSRALTLLALFALINPQLASACSCGDQTVQEAFAAAPNVFVGKVVKLEVLSTENGIDAIEATIRVGEVFKGEPKSEVKFITDTAYTACSYVFEIAKEYLLYANRQGKYYMTGACSRTALVEAAEEDLGVLRSQGQQ